MKMLVVCLSGSSQKTNHCQEMLLKSYWLHRGKEITKDSIYASKSFPRYTDAIEASTEMGIEFLSECLRIGVDYSLANSARSILPSIMKPVRKITFGMQNLNGIFNIRPTLSRYVKTWGFTNVFTFIKSNQLLQIVTRNSFLENSNAFVL